MKWGAPWGSPWGLAIPSPDFAQGIPTDGSLWSLLDGQQPGSLQLFPDTSQGAPVETIEVAVVISLFTDRRADELDEIPDGTGKRRGWWADPGFGSRLWLLARSALTPTVVQAVVRYAEEALSWIVDEGLASAFEVEATRVDQGVSLVVRVERGDGPDVELRFDDLWSRWR